MPHFAIAAVGADRPGIVAAVSGVLVDHRCNLEDTSMSILRGHFTMMLVVSAPDGVTAAQLEEAVGASVGDLVVTVRPIDEEVPASPVGDTWNLAVYGADRPGIVHRVSRLLADRSVNIIDLTTRVIGSDERPVYAMILDVTLPPSLDADGLARELAAVADELGVDCSLHPSEADIL